MKGRKRTARKPEARPASPAPRWLVWAPALLAAFIALPTLWNGFVLDDIVLLRDNRLGDFSRLFDLRRNELIVRYWSLQLDMALWRGSAWGFHLTNLLYFALIGGAVSAYLRALLRRVVPEAGPAGPRKLDWRDWAALAGACLFVANPMLTEAVSGVTHRKELLATGFMILALWRSLGNRSPARAVEVGAYLALAVFAKAIAVAFFPLVLLQDLWVRKTPLKEWLRRDLAFYLPAALAVAAFVAYRWTGIRIAASDSPQHFTGFNPQTAGLDPFLRLLTGVKTLGLYWGLLLFPWTPQLERFVSPAESASDPMAWFCIGLALAALVLAWRLRTRPLLALGLAWLVITPLPTLNLLPLNFLFAERYLFLPAVGLAFLAAGILVEWRQRRQPATPILALVAVLVLAGSVRAAVRHTDWKNEDTLLAATIRDNGDAPRVQYFHALRLREQGRLAESQEVIAVSLAALPNSPDAWHLAGRNHSDLGQTEDALVAFERANGLARKPPATWLNDQAVALLQLGRTEEALPLLRRAVDRDPNNERARDNLIQSLLLREDTRAEGLDELEKEVAAHPERGTPWILMVETRLAMGDTLGALRYREAARGQVDSPAAQAFLEARLLEARGETTDAITLYAQVAADTSATDSMRRRAATAAARTGRQLNP